MILLRKPLTVFDVDLVGGLLLAALAATALLGIVRPQLERDHVASALAEELAAAEREARAAKNQAQQTRAQTLRLRAAMDEDLIGLPTRESLARCVATLTEAAEAYGLRVDQVAPQPAQRIDGWMCVDLRITAVGRSTDFVRFASWLAAQNAYHAFVEFNLTADNAGNPAASRLTCLLRLNLPGERDETPPEARK